jgi:hypothetical protein
MPLGFGNVPYDDTFFQRKLEKAFLQQAHPVDKNTNCTLAYRVVLDIFHRFICQYEVSLQMERPGHGDENRENRDPRPENREITCLILLDHCIFSSLTVRRIPPLFLTPIHYQQDGIGNRIACSGDISKRP